MEAWQGNDLCVCAGANHSVRSSPGREGDKDYFSPGLLVLYCASSLLIPALGMIVYFARRANMRGSYSLVEAQKAKV